MSMLFNRKTLGYFLLLVIVSLCSVNALEAYNNSLDFSEVLRDNEGNLISDDRYVSFNIFSKEGEKKEWNYNETIRFNKGNFIVSIPDFYFDGKHNLVVTVSKGESIIRTQFSLQNEITLPEYLVILLGAVFIFFYGILKFNTWPKGVSEEYKLPPRHFTTFKRYFTYATIYVFLTELFFFMIVWAPDFFISLNTNLGGIQDKSLINSFKNNSVLWAVFLLTGVLPNFPWINRIEIIVRKTLHKMAFIPNKAKSAIDEFHKYPECFRAEPEVVDKIISENRGQYEKYDFLKQDNSFRHKWCKINYLLDRIRNWERKGEFNIGGGIRTVETQSFLRELGQLKKDIKILCKLLSSSRIEKQGSSTYNEWLETRIDVSINNLLTKIYTYISCNILSTEKIPQNRLKSYKFFGLYPNHSEKIYLDFDTIICSIFFILISILLPCLVSVASKNFLGFQSKVLKDGGDILMWVMYGVSMHGFTILMTSTALKYLYNHRFVAFGNRITIRAISSAIGYVIGFVIIGGGNYIQHQNSNFFNGATLLWPIVTAITGCFVAYHIEKTIPQERTAFRSALIQGLVTSYSAVLICLLLDNKDLVFLNTTVSIGFFVGFSIGYIYPLGYRNREKVNFEIQGCGRLMHRFKCVIPIKIVEGQNEISCQTVDINVRSLKINTSLEDSANRKLDVIFNSSLRVPGLLFRKAKDNAIIKLLYYDRKIGKNIQTLIDQTTASYA